jgi:hypothetical protein
MAGRMRKRKGLVLVGAGALLAFAGAGAAVAAGGADAESPITGRALQRVEQAALAETGGGQVTETEVGDEESLYEVEVTLEDGGQVDVQLDRNFDVVGSDHDSSGETEDQAGEDE